MARGKERVARFDRVAAPHPGFRACGGGRRVGVAAGLGRTGIIGRETAVS